MYNNTITFCTNAVNKKKIKLQFRLRGEMLVGGLKTTMSLGTALNSCSIGVNTCCSCCLKGTATPLLPIHPIMCDTCTQWREGATRWSPESDADENRVQKNPICVFVVTAEKRTWGGAYGGSFVVWSRSKELRNWGAGSKVIRPGLLKSGCTSPRCEAWRLTRWKAGSSPARAPGRLWVPVSLQCRSATCRLCRQIPWSCHRCVYHCW